ncbi:MAG TPA: hypothetical protein VE999_16085 [Gemmataceae bacterium]|nr:hypothetical protein [Gemmataceae bacterium]
MNIGAFRSDPAMVTQTVEVPASTAWPIVLAFGIMLVVAGLVTSESVSALGGLLAVTGAVGWFRDVFPRERHELLTVSPEVPAVTTGRTTIDRTALAPDRHRIWLPVEIYPISAGLRGGLAGSVAMAMLAIIYGLVSQRSIWYPINLLAATFFPTAGPQAAGDLTRFYPSMFFLAAALHLSTSILVGLLYGAMLPMLPRRPILLGGLVAPIVWSGVVYSILGIVSPVLDSHIDWIWFVISQIGFGVVAGIIVSRRERIPTWQRLPFALRAGLEQSGMRDESHHGGEQ